MNCHICNTDLNTQDCIHYSKLSNTLFELWRDGIVGNFGSFQTYIFDAYKVADCENMEILKTAFPLWFIRPYILHSKNIPQ